MHTVLKKLYRDHASFAQLMFILERQLGGLKPTEKVNVELLKNIIDYVSDYADRIHHPIEDLLYQNLAARTQQGRKDMDNLLVQHLVITNMTREFRQVLDNMDPYSIDSLAEVEKMGGEYIEEHRKHMQFEERRAFPLLNLELDPENFDNASGALPADEDPLLDRYMRERFPALSDYLEQEKASL